MVWQSKQRYCQLLSFFAFKCNQLFSILFYPKNSLYFCFSKYQHFALVLPKTALGCNSAYSVIFAFECVDFFWWSHIIINNLNLGVNLSTGYRCLPHLIVNLSLVFQSTRHRIVSSSNFSSSYRRWLKQLLVIVIVSSSVTFFNFETIWSTKRFQKVSVEKTHKKRILIWILDQNCLKVVPVKVSRVSLVIPFKNINRIDNKI